MDLIKVLSNPVRIRVMQYLQTHGEATTKQISEAISDVPAPTLYRHINTLLKEEVLLVKEERKVRGSLERLLVINVEKMSAASDSNISDSAYQFLMELYMKFHKYSCKDNADPQKDRLSLRTCVLNLTDDSFDNFMRDIASVIGKYQGAEENGKLRSVSFISAPVEEEGK
ncbi:MAG: helix-turn-helix domain-containing protein [Oscillospiraceae bacterium]